MLGCRCQIIQLGVVHVSRGLVLDFRQCLGSSWLGAFSGLPFCICPVTGKSILSLVPWRAEPQPAVTFPSLSEPPWLPAHLQLPASSSQSGVFLWLCPPRRLLNEMTLLNVVTGLNCGTYLHRVSLKQGPCSGSQVMNWPMGQKGESWKWPWFMTKGSLHGSGNRMALLIKVLGQLCIYIEKKFHLYLTHPKMST